MPTNKNALLRYQILDRCFSDFHRKYEIDDLVEKVNETLYDLYGTEVSLRQIRDDIKYMRDRVTYDAPIKAYKFDGKKCYYRYEDRNFSIFNNALTVEEVSKLRSTIEMLGRFRDGSKNAWLEEVISNLEYRFGIKGTNENVVSFEQNEQLLGLEYLSKVIDATLSHTPLIIDYKTYNGKELTSVFHPYLVKQYNNRWFLFGFEEETEKLANKALDRIQRISTANVPYKPNSSIDFGHFFDDVVGVSIPKDDVKKETITLRFAEARFPYVTSKPIHKSQRIISEDEHIISIEVKPTRELEQQILSFGADVEVLSPETFRLQIAEKIKENFKKYFPVQDGCTINTQICTQK